MADQAGTSDAQATASRRPSERDDGGYHVFLNFRGPDTRFTIADALRDALTRAGFRVFYDDEEIRKGEEIAGEIFSAIASSRICITIFSKDYASSKWCLREIAHMVYINNELKDGEKKSILPVFCDVDAADVKLKTKLYRKAMRKHEKESGEDAATWKEALKAVARIKGFNLKDYGIVKLVEVIKEEVFNKLDSRGAITTESSGLFGVHDQIEAITNLLELDNNSPDVKFIVIHGMGGIGKTTIAQHIFKKFSSRFQGNCILYDVRRSSSDDDVAKLQKKLLLDTLHLKCVEVSDIGVGIEMLTWKLRNQRVLLVLDDLDKWDQLRKLAAESSWFGPKSRIIITTRNIDFLPKVYHFYQMKELEHGHALQLFYWHAFRSNFLPPKYHDLASKIVATTGKLPLALEVIGCSLYNQDVATWEFILEKLKEAPHEDVQERLRISYQALAKEQKEIFLDIACFFNNERKTDPIYFWKACKFYPESGINILVRRSLIKVINNDKLWMHDQLRDLGRVIARSETPCEKCSTLTRPSRLWSPEVALDVLRKKEGVESIVALQLGTLDASCSFVREEFARLVNLKFLQLSEGNFKGDFMNVFQNLKWLSWINCPLEFQATNLSFDNLVILKLSGHHITETWGGWHPIKAAKHLKVLNLTDCPYLTRLFGLSAFPALERLILKDCDMLQEINWFTNELKSLNYLKISNGSKNFERYSSDMPEQPQLRLDFISGLTSLTVLKIYNVGLVELHHSIGELVALEHLLLRCYQLVNLPISIGKLTSLLQLDISFSGIKELPESVGDLKRLKILRMKGSAICHLPRSIGELKSLNELDISKTNINELPDTIGNLKSLKVMCLSNTPIIKLPMAIGNACNLEELDASECGNMNGEIPEEIGKLSSLRSLDFSNTHISGIPTTINQLSHLEELFLGHFDGQLPNLPISLTTLVVSCPSLDSRRIPDLSNLTNLVKLELLGFWGTLVDLQLQVTTSNMEWLIRLTKLEKLTLVLTDVTKPLFDLSSLSRLKELGITCSDPQLLTRLPPSLQDFTLYFVKSPIGTRCPLISQLKHVSNFKLFGCMLSEIQVDVLGELKNLQCLTVELGVALERLSGLSCLKNLRKLELSCCPKLIEIQGLEEVKMLESLTVQDCHSIERLPDLLSLQKLRYLNFESCSSLTSLPGVAKPLECALIVEDCRRLPGFEDSLPILSFGGHTYIPEGRSSSTKRRRTSEQTEHRASTSNFGTASSRRTRFKCQPVQNEDDE